jgi:hypothetical protein
MHLGVKKLVFFFASALPLFLSVVSAVSIGCGGSKEDNSPGYSVRGVVTYKRLPLVTDDDGRPIGLASLDDAEALTFRPLRGAVVRAVWQKMETMPDGSEKPVWMTGGAVATNSDGYYSINLKGLVGADALPVYVELLSTFSFYAADGTLYTIRVIADPAGINSDVPQADKHLYSLRKGLDGSEGDPMPAFPKEGETTLNFEIDLDTKWWIGHTNVKYADQADLETDGTGSRVAAIIDAAYRTSMSLGNPTPGGALDLHYRRGVTEPFGTYVEYDLERSVTAPDATGLNFVGSVRGGPECDDAWDEGALLSMMARNALRSTGIPGKFQFPPKKFPGLDPRNQWLASNLQPTMAMAEGLPDAMAAIALRTPYITAASGTEVRDIRDVRGLPHDIYSGPAIAAFAWELALKASGVESPGTPETWRGIEPLLMGYFYSLAYETASGEDGGSPTRRDVPSLLRQLRLMTLMYSEALTDEAVARLAEPFFGEGIWPRPEEGPLSRFMIDGGTDPDSPIPAFTFGMSDAVLDADEGGGRFSNLTAKENLVAKLALSRDTAYWLSVEPDPPLPAGASIEARMVECWYDEDDQAILERSPRQFFFASHLDRQRVALRRTSDGFHYLFYLSLKSPATRVPDTQIRVRLDPAY